MVVLLTALLAAVRGAVVVPLALAHNAWSEQSLTGRDIVVVWWAGELLEHVSNVLCMCYLCYFKHVEGRRDCQDLGGISEPLPGNLV
jgi:hypothetical protein